MIKIINVSGGYNGIKIISDINIRLKKGLITSIIGPNGCGKTTFMKVAARLILPYSGEILLNDTPISKIGPKDFAKQISVLPQVRNVPNISVNSLVMHGRFPYLGFPRNPSSMDKEMVEHAMELTGVIGYREKNLANLSGGERQKVYIAMVVAQNTDVIFLDEPTTYLDINHQFEVLELIKTLNKCGKTIVMVLHDISQALSYSDMICLMKNGKIISYETPKLMFEKKVIDDVFKIKSGRIYFEQSQQNHYYFY